MDGNLAALRAEEHRQAKQEEAYEVMKAYVTPLIQEALQYEDGMYDWTDEIQEIIHDQV